MKRLAALAITLLLVPATLAEQTTKPIRYTWIAASCETWNCAAAAMVLADGDPNLLVLPTGNEGRPWVMLKRVEEGSVFIPEDEPFTCTVYDSAANASVAWDQTESCHAPLLLSVPDGRLVVVSMRSCGAKQRGVR